MLPDPISIPRSARVDLPDAIIAHPLGATAHHPEYKAAKAGDPVAALRLARDLVTPDMVGKVRQIAYEPPPVLLPVLAIEQSGQNMIPLMVAERLSELIGLEVTTDVVQFVRAYRGSKSSLDRIFSQAAFEGNIGVGTTYFLIDDTVTQGGTFAALADHIRRHGGLVRGALALTGKQYSAILRLSDFLLIQLRERFGDIEDDFHRATGYSFDRLTESEARALVRFEPAHLVRDRILKEGNA